MNFTEGNVPHVCSLSQNRAESENSIKRFATYVSHSAILRQDKTKNIED